MTSSEPIELEMPRAPVPGLGLRAHALGELDRCIAQLARQGLQRHAGIHQARKSLRRTRATLALASGRLGARAERLDRRLRRLCRSLSDLRDAHAVIDTLARWRKALPEAERRGLRTMLRQARAGLEQRRDALLVERLERDPDLERLREKLVACRLRLESLPWARVEGRHLERALVHSTRRIRSAARAARRGGAIEDLHRWRRRLRRLRQQLTALADSGLATGDAVAPDPAELDALAWQQDLDVLQAAIASLDTLDPAGRQTLVDALRAYPSPPSVGKAASSGSTGAA